MMKILIQKLHRKARKFLAGNPRLASKDANDLLWLLAAANCTRIVPFVINQYLLWYRLDLQTSGHMFKDEFMCTTIMVMARAGIRDCFEAASDDEKLQYQWISIFPGIMMFAVTVLSLFLSLDSHSLLLLASLTMELCSEPYFLAARRKRKHCAQIEIVTQLLRSVLCLVLYQMETSFSVFPVSQLAGSMLYTFLHTRTSIVWQRPVQRVISKASWRTLHFAIKQQLNSADTWWISLKGSSEEQGMFARYDKLVSLPARMLFAPVEEHVRLTKSRQQSLFFCILYAILFVPLITLTTAYAAAWNWIILMIYLMACSGVLEAASKTRMTQQATFRRISYHIALFSMALLSQDTLSRVLLKYRCLLYIVQILDCMWTDLTLLLA